MKICYFHSYFSTFIRMDSYRIIVIGTGNVAWHMVRLLQNSPHSVIAVHGRNETHLREFADSLDIIVSNGMPDLHDIDIVILAVSDDAIHEVSDSLTGGPLFLHTSGTTDIQAIPHPRKGVIWPVRSLRKNQETNYSGMPVLVEAAQAGDLAIIQSLFAYSGAKLNTADSGQRLKAHLAAVIANNLVNDLWNISADIMSRSGMSFDLLKPMILEHAHKLENHHPSEIQTGPARRKDHITIQKHLDLLDDNSDIREIYAAISRHIERNTGE